MTSFGERVKNELIKQDMPQAVLCKKSGLKSGHISPYINGNKDRDPRLSTASAIAEALCVSLDYLAGRTDNPLGFCTDELGSIKIDADSVSLLQKITLLGEEGREHVRGMVDYELFKSETGCGDTVSGEAVA